ncbi:LysR family transcriptional regulator [Streptomyces sp. NPDC054849]
MRESTYADMRLLPALDALLQAGSVTGAACQLELSTAAMSRILSKIRLVVGDPLLVRAGRRLVPTPRALELQPVVHALVRQAEAILMPQQDAGLAGERRTLTIASEFGYTAALGPALLARAGKQLPRVSFRFLTKKGPGASPLREGTVDIEIGAIDDPSPELRLDLLGQEPFVGVTGAGNPLLRRPMTPGAFAAARHVNVSPAGGTAGPVDVPLKEIGLHRRVIASVPDFLSALFLLPRTDMVATLPRTLATSQDCPLDIEIFELPVQIAPLGICQAWHPRHEADPVHIWLRENIRSVLTGTFH